ncbi:MAG: uridine phosphorylase [Bacillota bacterium]|nr:uridine phosphorylase [Bacillota bacterium]
MEKLYHIDLDDSHGAKYAILPGDPARVPLIAKYLDDAKEIGHNREYLSYLGSLEGEKVLVMSTGMGGPSTAIGVEELYMTGVRNFIRVGTCGAMQLDIVGGDIVIATAAIKLDGTADEYVPKEFPAVADFDLTEKLVRSSRDLNYTTHAGVVECKDSFYGQHDPDRMPVGYMLKNKWEAYKMANCLASEMESATLFTLGSVLRARTACVLSVVWNQERAKAGMSNPENHDSDNAIKVAVEAIRKDILANK